DGRRAKTGKTIGEATMKRRIGIILLAVLVFGAITFFTLAPGVVENSANKVAPTELKVSAHAEALHKTLDVADMHADSLLWKRDLLKRSDRGQVDLPRLQAGHYALQVFSSVTKAPRNQNYDGNSGDTDKVTA